MQKGRNQSAIYKGNRSHERGRGRLSVEGGSFRLIRANPIKFALSLSISVSNHSNREPPLPVGGRERYFVYRYVWSTCRAASFTANRFVPHERNTTQYVPWYISFSYTSGNLDPENATLVLATNTINPNPA